MLCHIFIPIVSLSRTPLEKQTQNLEPQQETETQQSSEFISPDKKEQLFEKQFGVTTTTNFKSQQCIE